MGIFGRNSLIFALLAQALTHSFLAHAQPCTPALKLSDENHDAHRHTEWTSRDLVETIETPRLRLVIEPLTRLRKNAKIFTKEGRLIGEFKIAWRSKDATSILVEALSEKGMGYATEARFHLTKYVFDNFKIIQMRELVQSSNLPSVALHKKLGFELNQGSSNEWTQSVESFRSLERRLATDPVFARDFFTARRLNE